ncbi:MAG TPA: GDSL-type esterase/lipase family protein [bacterium]|nr:GDSL-type esterase/lipase family protein [bacterium]
MDIFKTWFLYPALFVMMGMNPASAQQGKTVIFCIGDSITWGQAFGTGHDYPTLLNKKFAALGITGIQFQNKGVSGDTVGDRLTYWSSSAGANVLARVDVHYVTIMLGTNDTRVGDETPTGVYLERLNALIDIFVNHANKDGTTPQVLLSLIPPHNSPALGENMASQFRDRFIHRDRIPNELNPGILQVARERGLRTIDCYTPLKAAGPDILPDGLHPAREGNEILAQAFFEVFWPILAPASGVAETVYDEFQ